MITEIDIRNAIKSSTTSNPRLELRDDGERGGGRLILVIRQLPARTLSEWYASWYREGKRCSTKIGSYPTIGLREARKLFRERYLPEILDGGNPAGPRAAKSRGVSVRDLFEAYVENLRAKGKRSATDAERILLGPSGVVHTVGATRLAREVKPAHILPHLAAIHARGSSGQANLVRAYIRAAFAFGVKSVNSYHQGVTGTDWGLEHNPAAVITVDTDAFQPRDRFLSETEFADFWRWLCTQDDDRRGAAAVRLMMATGQRPEEILRITKARFDPDENIIEWAKTKNGHAHAIPLPRQAALILAALEPNEHGLYFWRRSFHDQPGVVSTPRRFVHRYIAEQGGEGFECRDLRRTWKTLAGAAGLSKDVRDRLQNHRHHDVSSRHYDRWSYLPEKRDGMKVWEAYMDKILADAAGKAGLEAA